jgi:arylsulfatase A-like enzyme
LGCNGFALARTPNIDALAARGINFCNHFVTNPVCSPSRASIITGKYITEHGLWANGCRLPEDQPTLPKLLGESGYSTAHFGKLHLVPCLNRDGDHPSYGFDECEVAEGDDNLFTDEYGRWLEKNNPEMHEVYFSEGPTKGHDSGYVSAVSEKWHHSTWVTDRTVQWIDKRRKEDGPFYLSVGYFDPHHAFNPCEPYWSMFEGVEFPMPRFRQGSIDTRPAHYLTNFNGNSKHTLSPDNMQSIMRAYHAMVAHIDTCVGRILAALERRGLSENTLVIFTSDHGEMLGHHGMLKKGPFMLDDLLRVPLVIAPPGQSRSAVEVDDLTSGVDMLPAIVSLAGNNNGYETSGVPFLGNDLSLFPKGKRDHVFAQWVDGPPQNPGGFNPLVAQPVQRMIAGPNSADRSVAGDSAKPTSYIRCLRTRDFKIVTYAREDTGELYDLRTDPGEFVNVYDNPRYAQERQSLEIRLASLALHAGRQSVRESLW